jgi:hypothetical protein
MYHPTVRDILDFIERPAQDGAPAANRLRTHLRRSGRAAAAQMLGRAGPQRRAFSPEGRAVMSVGSAARSRSSVLP